MTARKQLAMSYAHGTHRGRQRRTNDDTGVVEELLLDDGRSLILGAIGDGMGGSRAGGDASQLAVTTALTYLRLALTPPPRDKQRWTNVLTTAIQIANAAVVDHSRTSPRLQGMGTTLLVTAVLGRRAWIAHVGDCRAYVVRPAVRRPQILQLTADHTVVAELVGGGVLSYQEADGHPQRHTLSRAVGWDDAAIAEVTARTLRTNERLLLCSDGVTLHLSDFEIARAVGDAPTPQIAVNQLIDLANARGGRDNISAIVIAAASTATPAPLPTS